MQNSCIISVVVIIVSISTGVWVKVISLCRLYQTVVERFSLPQRSDFIEFSIIDVLELKDDSFVAGLVKMSGDHGQMFEIYSGTPPDIVNSSSDVR